jgi:hypothetical protein
MDITKFVVGGRETALLYGDFATYHNQLSKRLLNCRKKLGIATKNRGKYQKKPQITSEDLAQNEGYVLPYLAFRSFSLMPVAAIYTCSSLPASVLGRRL